MLVYGKKGTYQLSIQPMKSGGEGAIYTVEANNNYVAKIYYSERITNELEAKLTLMMSNPPDSSVLSQIAWPYDVIRDSNGHFVGFIMPRLSIDTDLKDIYVYPPKKELQLSIDNKLVLALNICSVINCIHRAGYVFGDFNPMNIGVNSKTGRVAFLDTDSYHIIDKTNGKTYRCGVCMDGYVAPELIQQCKGSDYLHAPLPTFTKETDLFALAIHIFKLLMNGFTPFNGIKEADNISTANPGVGNRAIEFDNYCFKPGNKPLSVATPDLRAFPPEIQSLFRKAFIDGRSDPKKRPTASEWYYALLDYRNNLKRCSIDNLHFYYKSNDKCPYCEAAERYAKQFVTSNIPSQISFVTPPSNSSPVNVPTSSSGTVSGINTGAYVGSRTYNTNTQRHTPPPKPKISPILFIVCALFGWLLIRGMINTGRQDADIENWHSRGGSNATVVATENPYVQNVSLVNYNYLQADKSVKLSSGGGKTNTGDTFSSQIYSESPYSCVTFNLSGQYDYFSAKWALTADGKNTQRKNSFDIYTDGVLAYSSPVLEAGSLPVDVRVSTANCNLLTIMFKEGTGAASLMDPLLYNEGVKMKPSIYYTPGVLPCWLTDLESLSKDNAIEVYSNYTTKTNTGESAAHGIGCIYDNNSIEYYLRGNYKRITGLWTLLMEGRNYTKQQQFELYADDVLICKSPAISAGSIPLPFDLDINYCQKLRITFTSAGHDDILNPTALIANVRLYPGDEGKGGVSYTEASSASTSRECYLTDLEYLEKSWYAKVSKNSHLISSLYDDHYIDYYLGGNYSYLTGSFVMLETCTRGQSFEVFADGNLVYTSPYISTGSEDVAFSIDVSGVSVLRIHFIQANNSTATFPASGIKDAKIG